MDWGRAVWKLIASLRGGNVFNPKVPAKNGNFVHDFDWKCEQRVERTVMCLHSSAVSYRIHCADFKTITRLLIRK